VTSRALKRHPEPASNPKLAGPDSTTVRIPTKLRDALRAISDIEDFKLTEYIVRVLMDDVTRYEQSTGLDLAQLRAELLPLQPQAINNESNPAYIGCDRSTHKKIRVLATLMGIPLHQFVSRVLEREAAEWERINGLHLNSLIRTLRDT